MSVSVRPLVAVLKLALVSGFLLGWADSGSAQGDHGSHSHPGHFDPSSGFHHPSSGFHHTASGFNQNPSAGFLGVGGGGFAYNPGIYLGNFGSNGFYGFPPALTLPGPGAMAGLIGTAFPMGLGGFGNGGGGGLNLPMPPGGRFNAAQPGVARRTNTAHSKELTEIGDRSFRGHNIKRAEEKYNLAAKADPTSPVPHVHLAQVAIARGRYTDAADHLRDAVTVATDAGWLVNTPDIQAIFGEPADFARQVGKLETHLQANPNDRDAWFVLGAETYLSGRTRQAFDVFQRLTDRRADEALAAFLDASRPPAQAAN